MVFLGNPEYGVALQPIDFVKVAEACGGHGFRVEEPARVGEVLDQALAIKKPVVIEAVVDPFEPPMPAQVTREQALHTAEALARGEVHRGKIAETLFRDKVSDLLAPSGNGGGPVEAVKEKVREVVGRDL
jgi:pyruvate dehydrogenase (quinone)/pyruvate oxidase